MTDLRFILTHYEPDAFRPRLRFCSPFMRHARALAAASTAAVVLVAAACYYVITTRPSATSAPAEQTLPAATESIYTQVQRLEFVDASLPEVAAAIEATYGVTIVGVESADPDIRLTLSYEGTAADIVATINDLTGANLQIEEAE